MDGQKIMHAENFIGMDYESLKKILISHGYRQRSTKSRKSGDNGVLTWWVGSNEDIHKIEITHSWKNVSYGVRVPAKVLSVSATDPFWGDGRVRK